LNILYCCFWNHNTKVDILSSALITRLYPNDLPSCKCHWAKAKPLFSSFFHDITIGILYAYFLLSPLSDNCFFKSTIPLLLLIYHKKSTYYPILFVLWHSSKAEPWFSLHQYCYLTYLFDIVFANQEWSFKSTIPL